MAKRVQVERLRPKTQNDVFVRPVNTYVTPAPDQETSLMKLSKTVERLVPELNRKLASWDREKTKKWEDDSRDAAARAAAKGVFDTNEAVKKGLIPPDASPVAHYKLNELHGEQLGYDFSTWLSQEYLTDPIRTQNDPSQYRNWYLQKHEEYSQKHADVLAKEGASTAFLTVSDSVFNSQFNQHKQTATKNFIAEAKTRYSTTVMNAAARYDLTTEEGRTQFGMEIENHRQELYETSGMGFRETGEMAIDALIAQYSQTNDYVGLSNAVAQLKGGTGALINTAYAKTKLAEAKLAFTKAELVQTQQEEPAFKINQSRTNDKVAYYVNQKLADGKDAETIQRELLEEHPELMSEADIYDPDWRTTLMEDAKKYTGLVMDKPMHVDQLVSIREELEALPASERVKAVHKMAREKRITDMSEYKTLVSWAESTAEKGGEALIATKDPYWKEFSEGEYKTLVDKYLPGQKAKRLSLFRSAYYEKFDEVDPETGERVWFTMKPWEREAWLDQTMNDILGFSPKNPPAEPAPVNNGAENPLANGTTQTAPENPMVPENTGVTPSGRTFTPVEPVEPVVKPEPQPEIDYRDHPELMKGYPFPEGSYITGEEILQNIRNLFGLNLSAADTAFLPRIETDEDMDAAVREYLKRIEDFDD